MLAKTLKGLAAAAIIGAAIASTPSAVTAAPLIGGLGGPAGYGVNNLPPNDDGSTPTAIDITGAFPRGLRFFGMTFTSVWINNNGNITFGGPLPTYTPRAFPVASQRMIAPFWGDVDTRGDGRPARNGVYWDIRPGQFTVTWHNVGYFYIHDDLQNDFQMILTPSPECGEGDFDVEFRYNRCEWTTGDASGGMGGFGGTPAQAGFDAGDSVNYYALPGSLTRDILNLCTTSNVGIPGVWRFQIRGGELPCDGGGRPCMTGMPGICAEGTIQCRGGRPTCVPTNMPRPETCDGLDTDCDGTVDNGDMLCPAGEMCLRGTCVAPCVESSCFPGETCTRAGICVETACVDVTCPEGQRCVGGMCVGACDGITCPHGQVCRVGRCVDPCAGVTCDTGSVCVAGVCRLRCQCRGCPMGEACQMDGHCVPEGCELTTCASGTYCVAGRCVDACEGAVCPRGERCEGGNCVPIPMMPDAGSDVVIPPRDAHVENDASVSDAARDATTDVSADGGPVDSGPFLPPARRAGCGCRTASDTSAPGRVGVALAALGLALALRRRRR